MPSAACTFVPTSADVERYKRLRRLAMDLNQRMVRTIPREAICETGSRLGIMRRGVLVFRSVDETNILMDCCLYDWMRDGRNVVENYAASHPALPGTDEAELLQGFLQAKYRVLVPTLRSEGAGAYASDILAQAEEIFLMDIGLSLGPLEVILASRTIPLGGFSMTAGAVLPASPEVLRRALDLATRQGLVENGRFIDRHRLTLLIVRALLADGASEHVAYETVFAPPRSRAPAGLRSSADTAPKAAYVPSRNSCCPCGSRRRYKKCCGAKPSRSCLA